MEESKPKVVIQSTDPTNSSDLERFLTTCITENSAWLQVGLEKENPKWRRIGELVEEAILAGGWGTDDPDGTFKWDQMFKIKNLMFSKKIKNTEPPEEWTKYLIRQAYESMANVEKMSMVDAPDDLLNLENFLSVWVVEKTSQVFMQSCRHKENTKWRRVKDIVEYSIVNGVRQEDWIMVMKITYLIDEKQDVEIRKRMNDENNT